MLHQPPILKFSPLNGETCIDSFLGLREQHIQEDPYLLRVSQQEFWTAHRSSLMNGAEQIILVSSNDCPVGYAWMDFSGKRSVIKEYYVLPQEERGTVLADLLAACREAAASSGRTELAAAGLETAMVLASFAAAGFHLTHEHIQMGCALNEIQEAKQPAELISLDSPLDDQFVGWFEQCIERRGAAGGNAAGGASFV